MAARYEIVEYVHTRAEPPQLRKTAGHGYSIRSLVGTVNPEKPMPEKAEENGRNGRPAHESTDRPLREAEAYYSERLGAYPQDLWALNNMALVALRRQESDEALGYLQQALDAHQQITDALHTTLVLALMKSDRPDLVERIAPQAVQVRQTLRAITRELLGQPPGGDSAG